METNPFTFAGPVGLDDVIDRDDELKTLLERVQSRVPTRLSAPRDYGKTSLLKRLVADATSAGWLSIYIDLYGIRTRDRFIERVDEGYSSLSGKASKLYDSFRRRGGYINAAGWGAGLGGSESGDVNLERKLRRMLDLPDEFASKEKQPVLVIFDEFQAVLEAGDELDAVMRSVIQHHTQTSYVFAGSHPGMMSALFSDRKRAFYGEAAPLVLSPLPPQPLAQFIEDRFSATGRTIDAGVLGELLDLTEGHPQRAMLLANIVWFNTPTGGVADIDAWTIALAKVWDYIANHLKAEWDALSALEKGVLEAVASSHSGLTARRTREEFHLPTGEGGIKAARRLAGDGILFEAPDYATGFRIVDPLLAHWVAAGRRWPFLERA